MCSVISHPLPFVKVNTPLVSEVFEVIRRSVSEQTLSKLAENLSQYLRSAADGWLIFASGLSPGQTQWKVSMAFVSRSQGSRVWMAYLHSLVSSEELGLTH